MLTGFTAAFLLSALALMGHQTYRTLGVEWLVVALLAGGVNTNGYVQGLRQVGSRYALSLVRIVVGSACYLAQIIGALILCVGSRSGTYVAAIALIVNFVVLISGSWLLIVGTSLSSD